MDECLGDVAAKLALAHIELFGEEAWRPAGRSVAFEPRDGLGFPPLLKGRQAHEISAKQECSLGISEWAFVLGESVYIALPSELLRHGPDGGSATWIKR